MCNNSMDLDGFLSSFDPESTLSSFHPEKDFQFYKEIASPGYHFVPKDSEMALYLLLKERGHPLANIFQEVLLNDYNPDELQRKFNKGKGDELYLYTKIKPLKNGWRVERKAGSGRWKNLKRGEGITHGGRTIAYKTTLTYYVVKDKKEEKTYWSMHEYRLRRKKGERQMGDDVVLCKIYKRGGAGKTGEAIDEENNEETCGSTGSCNYRQSSTTVSNDGLLGQSFPDLPMAAVNDTFQFAVSPIEDSVTPMNIGHGGFAKADVNDPLQFEQSPIEDSATGMNVFGDFSKLADEDDPFQLAGLPPIEDSETHMNVYGYSSMAEVDDPFQFAGVPPIEHLATHMNGWGDFATADDLWNF